MEKNILQRRLQEDLKVAVKARNKENTSSLRMMISALKNAELEEREELSEEQEIAVLGSYARKCRESLSEFEKAGREELVAESRIELEFVMSYLPEQMGEEDVKREIALIIEETGAKGPRDMGKVMGLMMQKHKGSVDGKMVKEIALKMLQQD